MKSALDITETQLALLKTVELPDVCAVINSIVNSIAAPRAAGVLIWDQDFDAFSDEHRYVFGSLGEDLLELFSLICGEEIGESELSNDNCICGEMDPAGAATELSADILPIIYYKVRENGRCAGLIVICGDKDLTSKQLEEHLSHYQLFAAISNAYEVSELRSEVERLRGQYEQLETALQEQRQLNDTLGGTGKHTFRMEQNDKEKLVYEISNSVRSSLETQEVLQTAVIKIGQTFQLSRCLTIWPDPETDDFTVYEYAAESVRPVKDIFFTRAGREFVKVASTKTAPHDLILEGERQGFDPEFLEAFIFLSGMLVPLIYRDRNIGSLFLQDCVMAREWSIDNTALIGSLADLISVAIEHANLHAEQKRQAITDGLTGISNRRYFNENLAKEFERANRYGSQLSLVIVDLDYLKKINDNYGHNVGDEAIKVIGGVLAKSCRSIDTAARYGGEEFCLLLPDTDTEDAVRLAERVRKVISETHIEGPGQITASVGVATFPAHANDQDGLFQAADHALYAAKSGGRNRVCTAEIT